MESSPQMSPMGLEPDQYSGNGTTLKAKEHNPEKDQLNGLESPDQITDDEPSFKTRDIMGLRWFLICISLYVTCFLYGLDTTIAADVQGPLIAEFGHIEQLAWVGAGFPLGSVCVLLLFGNIYNLFNMKWVFILSVILFEIGSALCGAAPAMSALIVGRAIAGAGGSGIYLGVLNFVATLTVPKERGLYMSMIGLWWGVGAVLGPVIGGAFSISSATWRWAFYINLVIGAVLAPVFLFYLPPLRAYSVGLSIRDRIGPLDFVGFFLGAGVWVAFLLAFTMAGGQWPWNDGRTIATFVVFGAVLIIYILQQYFAIFTTPERRAFPGHLLLQRTQLLLYFTTSAGITSLFVVVYYIPIYFQFVANDNALMAAVRLLPFVVVAVVMNLLSGAFLGNIKIYMLIYVVSGVFITIGGALLSVYLKPSTSTETIYGLMVVTALGSGLAMTSGFAISSLTTKPQDTNAGITMQNIAQIGAQVIALAVAGQIFQSTAVQNLTNALAGRGFTAAEIRGAVAGVHSTVFEQLEEGEVRDAAILAITKAMQTTIVLVPVAGGVMLIAALCMKREKLFGKATVAAI